MTQQVLQEHVSLIAAIHIIQSINMTKVKEIYLCEVCGNKVQVLESGAGQLVCCGQPMKKVAK
jgi:desulfoferrodoxin-like iron-binding protein